MFVNNIDKTPFCSNNKIFKRLSIGTLTTTAGLCGCNFAFRRFEQNAYRMNKVETHFIPELQNNLKIVKLKTGNGLAFDAIDINPENKDKYIIFCNGMFSLINDNNQNRYLELLKSGYGVIGFDYPGRGSSKDMFSQKNAQQSLETVYNYLTNIKGIEPENIGLVGHSMGCAVASEFASTHNAKFLILLSPFNKAAAMVKQFVNRSNYSNGFKKVINCIPYSLMPVKYKFNNEKYLKNIECPILIIGAKDDKTVPIGLTRKLKEKHSTKTNLKYFETELGGHEVDKPKLTKTIEFIQSLDYKKNV